VINRRNFSPNTLKALSCEKPLIVVGTKIKRNLLSSIRSSMKASSGSSCKEGDRAFILRRGMVQFSGVNQVKLYMRLTTVSFYLGLEMCEYDALTVDLFSCGCQLVFYIHHLSIIAFFDEYQGMSVSLLAGMNNARRCYKKSRCFCH